MLKNEVKIREAVTEDTDYLYRIEQKLINEERPYNASTKETNAKYYEIEKLIADEKTLLLIAEVEKIRVGSGYAQIRKSKNYLNHKNEAYLNFMYVESEYRGRGINRIIVNDLISWSRPKGIRNFYLDVYSGNVSAISAYKKIGFTESLIEMKLSL